MTRTLQWGALALLLAALVPVGGHGQTPLVVYTYDSFVSFGPASEIESRFEEISGTDVQFVATDDSRAMLARMRSERDSGGTPADVFIGVEANALRTATRGRAFVPLDEEAVPNLARIPADLRFDPQDRLVPYEHGFITLVYDAEQIAEDELPRTFEDLLDTRFRDALIVQDPRTSSPGLSFLLWTIRHLGDPGYLDYWRELLPNVLTVTPGWTEAFNLFTQGEAPMMVSFSTDHAFDVIVNGSEQIRVLLLNNQGYRTVFGAGVVDSTDQPDVARRFVDFLLSREVQALLPTSEWMFPSNPEALLPVKFYQNAVQPPQPVALDVERVGENLEGWLRAWSDVLTGG